MPVRAIDEFGGNGISTVGLISDAACIAEPWLTAERDELEPFTIRTVIECIPIFTIAARQHPRDFNHNDKAYETFMGFKERAPMILKNLFDSKPGFWFQYTSPSQFYKIWWFGATKNVTLRDKTQNHKGAAPPPLTLYRKYRLRNQSERWKNVSNLRLCGVFFNKNLTNWSILRE